MKSDLPKHPENYNSPALVDIWTEYVDWDLRRKGENGFLIDNLRKNDCTKILDASLGDGCDSIYLLKNGFEVTSNEIDSVFIEKAVLNARKNNVELRITAHDWREFDRKFGEGSFDSIILLGNSFTYLFTKKDQIRALEAFNKILGKNGVLIIDERNYQRILDQREQIKHGAFDYSRKYVYCGKRVEAKPIEISDKKVVLSIAHENGKEARLTVYPFKKGELRSLLAEAGFKNIKTFSDYRQGYNYKSDFVQHIAFK